MGVVHSTAPSDGNVLGPLGQGTSGPERGGMSAAYRSTPGPGRPATVAKLNGWGRGDRVRCACVLGLGWYREWLDGDLLLQALRVEAGETRRMARYGTPRLKTQLLHRSRYLMEEMTWRLHRANGGGNCWPSSHLPQRRWE